MFYGHFGDSAIYRGSGSVCSVARADVHSHPLRNQSCAPPNWRSARARPGSGSPRHNNDWKHCQMGWGANYIEKLKTGDTVSFRRRGNSMVGRIAGRRIAEKFGELLDSHQRDEFLQSAGHPPRRRFLTPFSAIQPFQARSALQHASSMTCPRSALVNPTADAVYD